MLKRLSIGPLLLLYFSRASFPSTIENTPVENCKPSQYNYNSYNEEPSPFIFGTVELGRAIDCYRDDISAISAIFIAAFTIILGIFTIRLAKSTKAAADAARAAVEALPVVERAYVYPIIVSSEGVAKYINDGLVFWLNDPSKDDTPSEDNVKVTFRLKDYGKTPAIVKEVFAGLGVRPIGAEMGIAVVDSILGAMESTGEFIADAQRGISASQSRSILYYTGWFCLTGTIEFADIWGNEYITRFEFTWGNDVQRMTLSRIRTEQKRDTHDN